MLKGITKKRAENKHSSGIGVAYRSNQDKLSEQALGQKIAFILCIMMSAFVICSCLAFSYAWYGMACGLLFWAGCTAGTLKMLAGLSSDPQFAEKKETLPSMKLSDSSQNSTAKKADLVYNSALLHQESIKQSQASNNESLFELNSGVKLTL